MADRKYDSISYYENGHKYVDDDTGEEFQSVISS